MTSTILQQSTQTGFQLKANSITITTIELSTVNLDVIANQLELMAQQTPNFFNATPVIIDLTNIDARNLPLDLSQLIAILKTHNLIPVGIKTSNQAYKASAGVIDLAVMNNTQSQQANKPESSAKTTIKTIVIDQPVRSGKQIYAKGADLIVNASVSHGAEVLADGNIHIYGSLKGRALAGVQGDPSARIYCKFLDAELIAIAGHYLVSEQIPEAYKEQGELLEIRLNEQSLHFKHL